jgi:hypothetical protein
MRMLMNLRISHKQLNTLLREGGMPWLTKKLLR